MKGNEVLPDTGGSGGQGSGTKSLADRGVSMRESDWKVLRTLYLHQNITKAAELPYMSQPTLTKRLQRIEREWDALLMFRGKKGVVFTPAGACLAEEAEVQLERYDRIRKKLANIASGFSGTIQIGVSNSFGRYMLPSLLHEYGALRPDVSFDISTAISSAIVGLAEQKKLHMGIISGDIPFDGIRKRVCLDQAYVISRDPVDLKCLHEIPQIRQTLSQTSSKFFDAWWNEHFQQPPLIGMSVNQSSTCYEMVSRGLGYAIVLIPEPQAAWVKLHKIPLYKKDGTALTRNTWAICHADFYEISLVKDWISFLSEKYDPGEVSSEL